MVGFRFFIPHPSAPRLLFILEDPVVIDVSLLESVGLVLLSALVGLAMVAVYLGFQWLTQQKLEGWAAVAVRAAEQIFESGDNQAKLNYAINVVKQVFPRLDDQLIRALVETGVHDLKLQASVINMPVEVEDDAKADAIGAPFDAEDDDDDDRNRRLRSRCMDFV